MEQWSAHSPSTQTSAKYFVECPKITAEKRNTEDWLDIFENIKERVGHDDANLIFNGLIHNGVLGAHRNVVVKLSESSTLDKEYNTSLKMHQDKVVGILKFICFFKCHDYLQNYKSKTKKSPKAHVCDGIGDNLRVLVMPHIKEGSFGDFQWKSSDQLKSGIKQVVASMFQALHSSGVQSFPLRNETPLSWDQKHYVFYATSVAS